MKLARTLTTLLLPLISIHTVSAADVEAWKSRNIYFALTDRVARGSDDTGGDACGNLGDYCGGTFQGLESKLDYIQGMGFDAIWITPVVASELFKQFLRLFNWLIALSFLQMRQVDIMDTGRRTSTVSMKTMARLMILKV